MVRAHIVFHLPTHRRTALKLQAPGQEAEATYDRYIGDYIRYLQEEGQRAGFRVETDQSDMDAVFRIDELDHEQKKAAYAWLQTLPDIWNWIP